MTYLQFHLVFIIPWLIGLGLWTWWEMRTKSPSPHLAGAYSPNNRWSWLWYFLLPMIALVYTTPWDNYLVYRGVWFYGPERVIGTIGYVPIEEYLFFILQPLAVGLWLYTLLRRDTAAKISSSRVRWMGTTVFAVLGFVGAALLFMPKGLYLGLILAWACPVIALQWAFGGDLIMGNARTFWLGLLPPTVYLWVADTLAIGWGIWDISLEHSLGWRPFSLPIEEATFFLITNLLVVQGLLLFLHPEAMKRVQVLASHFRPWMGFVVLSLLLKIPVPLWPAGFPWLATASTVMIAIAALLWCAERLGLQRALSLALMCFGLGLLVEWIGSQTGIPFGPYDYPNSGFMLFGVPLLVPLGWWGMTLAAYVLSQQRPWLAGLLLVAWDIGLEPLMTSRGFWEWQSHWSNSGYYQVPWLNFLGWYLVGVLLCYLLKRLTPDLGTDDSLAWVYKGEAIFLPLGLVLLGLYPAALACAVAMATAWWLAQRSRRPSLPAATTSNPS